MNHKMLTDSVHYAETTETIDEDGVLDPDDDRPTARRIDNLYALQDALRTGYGATEAHPVDTSVHIRYTTPRRKS